MTVLPYARHNISDVTPTRGNYKQTGLFISLYSYVVGIINGTNSLYMACPAFIKGVYTRARPYIVL